MIVRDSLLWPNHIYSWEPLEETADGYWADDHHSAKWCACRIDTTHVVVASQITDATQSTYTPEGKDNVQIFWRGLKSLFSGATRPTYRWIGGVRLASRGPLFIVDQSLSLAFFHRRYRWSIPNMPFVNEKRTQIIDYRYSYRLSIQAIDCSCSPKEESH